MRLRYPCNRAAVKSGPADWAGETDPTTRSAKSWTWTSKLGYSRSHGCWGCRRWRFVTASSIHQTASIMDRDVGSYSAIASTGEVTSRAFLQVGSNAFCDSCIKTSIRPLDMKSGITHTQSIWWAHEPNVSLRRAALLVIEWKVVGAELAVSQGLLLPLAEESSCCCCCCRAKSRMTIEAPLGNDCYDCYSLIQERHTWRPLSGP